MADSQSRFLISAPSSNSGKTTITLGLLRALKNRGLQVQPFKCGPDYIDTIHHTRAAGTPSINLDTFMSSEMHVKAVFQKYSLDADASVTEGVMGLFDGANKMQGSSAAIANLLDIPVIMVINAKSMAYSAAPLLFGFKNFDKRIRVVGAIFNFVNTASHYSFLKDACTDAGVEALGYLPADERLAIPSRHLGLKISSDTNYESIIEKLAAEIPKTVNIDRLLEITSNKIQISDNEQIPNKKYILENKKYKDSDTDILRKPYSIAVARDEAFSFTYQQNIEILEQAGTVTFFSPLHDSKLPKTDFLYLPGGYPELFAKPLSENLTMLESIRNFCQRGGLTYAECGGFMYLGRQITDANGGIFNMAGVLDCTSSMQNAKMTLGYRIATWDEMEIKGHEFHYSSMSESQLSPASVKITNTKGIELPVKLYRSGNTFASYLHFYWGDNPGFLEKLRSSVSREI